MEVKKLIEKINLKNFTEKQLMQIYNKLNRYKWSNLLGEKPEIWDNLPNYILNNPDGKLAKNNIVSPICIYIESKISQKKLIKYDHINNGDSNKIKFELWWQWNHITDWYYYCKMVLADFIDDLHYKAEKKASEQYDKYWDKD